MATRRLAKPRPVQGEQVPPRRPAEEPGSCTDGWSPPTESGLQACYGKSPGNGAFSMRSCCSDLVVVSVRQPLGGLVRLTVRLPGMRRVDGPLDVGGQLRDRGRRYRKHPPNRPPVRASVGRVGRARCRPRQSTPGQRTSRLTHAGRERACDGKRDPSTAPLVFTRGALSQPATPAVTGQSRSAPLLLLWSEVCGARCSPSRR